MMSYVVNLVNFWLDIGLSPDQHQVINRTKFDILYQINSQE